MYKELTDYDKFISICTEKGLLIQSNFRQETPGSDKYYELVAIDGNIRYECHLNSIDTSTGLADFEANYLSTANRPLDIRETETGIIKTKPRPVEGTLTLAFIYFTTGEEASLDYGEEIEDEGFAIDTSTGITMVTFTPTFSYYIDGGGVTVVGSSTGMSTIEASFIMAPNIPAEYGGSWKFIKHKRLWKVGQSFTLDVPPKYVKYYEANPYANELRLEIIHEEDAKIALELSLRTYR